MNILIEVPNLPDEIDKTLAAVDHRDCWDGFAIDGVVLEQVPAWEDSIDSVEIPWHWLNSLLPDDIAARLFEMGDSTCQKFLEHTEMTLRRGASLSLKGASIDLSVDRLGWPREEGEEEDLEAELAARVAIMQDLVKRSQNFDVMTCLSLRLPLPSIAKAAENLAVRLIRGVGNSQCRLMLNVVIDELKSIDPDLVLSPYFECLAAIRLRYEPQLGVRPSAEMQKSWADCLHEHGFAGSLIFAPLHRDVAGFEYELEKLASEVPNWRR